MFLNVCTQQEEEQNENSDVSSDGEAQWENDSSSRFRPNHNILQHKRTSIMQMKHSDFDLELA